VAKRVTEELNEGAEVDLPRVTTPSQQVTETLIGDEVSSAGREAADPSGPMVDTGPPGA
jgi:hypothetical protein